MYLDAVRNITNETNVNTAAKPVETLDKKAVYEHWRDWQPSQISHHLKLCCEIAREWITATDFSALNGDGALTGPVARGDAGTVSAHLGELTDLPQDIRPAYLAQARATALRAARSGRLRADRR